MSDSNKENATNHPRRDDPFSRNDLLVGMLKMLLLVGMTGLSVYIVWIMSLNWATSVSLSKKILWGIGAVFSLSIEILLAVSVIRFIHRLLYGKPDK